MSHRNIWLWQNNEGSFLQYIFLFLSVRNSEFLENLINQELLYQTTFWCGLVLNGLNAVQWCSIKNQKGTITKEFVWWKHPSGSQQNFAE